MYICELVFLGLWIFHMLLSSLAVWACRTEWAKGGNNRSQPDWSFHPHKAMSTEMLLTLWSDSWSLLGEVTLGGIMRHDREWTVCQSVMYGQRRGSTAGLCSIISSHFQIKLNIQKEKQKNKMVVSWSSPRQCQTAACRCWPPRWWGPASGHSGLRADGRRTGSGRRTASAAPPASPPPQLGCSLFYGTSSGLENIKKHPSWHQQQLKHL